MKLNYSNINKMKPGQIYKFVYINLRTCLKEEKVLFYLGKGVTEFRYKFLDSNSKIIDFPKSYITNSTSSFELISG